MIIRQDLSEKLNTLYIVKPGSNDQLTNSKS